MESGGGSIAKLINVVGGSQRQDLMTTKLPGWRAVTTLSQYTAATMEVVVMTSTAPKSGFKTIKDGTGSTATIFAAGGSRTMAPTPTHTG